MLALKHRSSLKDNVHPHMKSSLVYVELKSGHSDNGPAWIGKAEYSKSKRMLYFNGMALRQLARRQNCETHVNPETGDHYWVSGAKRDQTDRHWAGSGKIMVDEGVVREYLEYVGATQLRSSRYAVVAFASNEVIRAKANAMENRKLAPTMPSSVPLTRGTPPAVQEPRLGSRSAHG